MLGDMFDVWLTFDQQGFQGPSSVIRALGAGRSDKLPSRPRRLLVPLSHAYINRLLFIDYFLLVFASLKPLWRFQEDWSKIPWSTQSRY
jgi:hypothetical protein